MNTVENKNIDKLVEMIHNTLSQKGTEDLTVKEQVDLIKMLFDADMEGAYLDKYEPFEASWDALCAFGETEWIPEERAWKVVSDWS